MKQLLRFPPFPGRKSSKRWARSELTRRTTQRGSPELSAGNVDAAWDRIDEGEETVGGSHATPDQDVVDELGKAVGVTYNENEPLRLGQKEEERDSQRWELDPASSEDYEEHVSRGKSSRSKHTEQT